MSGISGIEALGAPPHAHPREERANRAPVDFGGAITHRELVADRVRVEPAALAEKKRTARNVRAEDEPPRERVREERLALEHEAYMQRRDERGAHVDIEA